MSEPGRKLSSSTKEAGYPTGFGLREHLKNGNNPASHYTAGGRDPNFRIVSKAIITRGSKCSVQSALPDV